MRRGYSRHAQVEQKKNIKKAYLYIFLSIVAVGFLFFLGLPLLIKFVGFFTNLGKADKPVDTNDSIPPAPPQFENIIEYTNQRTFKLEGKSEDGAVVTLSLNGKDQETVANSEGKFSFELNLKDGQNNFSAKAQDQAGNTGQESENYKITFDDQAPELTINSPNNDDVFYGPTQRQISIKGNTDSTSEVHINDRFVSVADDGTFSFTTTLNEGINEFNIKSVDKAGNETSTILNLNFTP